MLEIGDQIGEGSENFTMPDARQRTEEGAQSYSSSPELQGNRVVEDAVCEMLLDTYDDSGILS